MFSDFCFFFCKACFCPSGRVKQRIKSNDNYATHYGALFTEQRFCLCCRILDEREEPGFLTGLKIPAPWAAGKTVETVHPVRDNYKFKETVHIPGARCLYLRFDSRCSSQYDYDKVTSAGILENIRLMASVDLKLRKYGYIFLLKTFPAFSAGDLRGSQHQQP